MKKKVRGEGGRGERIHKSINEYASITYRLTKEYAIIKSILSRLNDVESSSRKACMKTNAKGMNRLQLSISTPWQNTPLQ